MKITAVILKEHVTTKGWVAKVIYADGTSEDVLTESGAGVGVEKAINGLRLGRGEPDNYIIALEQ